MLPYVVFSFCLLCLTSAFSPLCVRGPEYWCRDAQTAQDCGAVRHCQQTVWREEEVPQSSSSTSKLLCNVLVEAASQLVKDGNMDSTAITNFLRSDCLQLPNENNLVQQCQMAVDLYVTDILRHIDSNTIVANICPIIQGHDVPSTNTQQLLLPTLSADPNKTCVMCEFVVHLLQVLATANTTEGELSKLLENVCTIMPETLRTECKTFVQAFGDSLIEVLLREFDPPRACRFLRLCPKSINVAFLTKPNEGVCGLCDYVETYLKMGHPKNKVCTHFRDERRQQCETFVQLSAPCSKLPVCPKEEPMSLVTPQEGEVSDTAPCTLCKYVVTYLDAILQNNKSEAAVVDALEKVCNILPGKVKEDCDTFVDTYGPVLAQLLAKYATPDAVCDVLRLCVNASTVVSSPKAETKSVETKQLLRRLASPRDEPRVDETKNVRNDAECSICRYVMSYLNAVLARNETEAEVKKLLENVCSILPSSDEQKCISFIDTYAPVLVQMLAELDDPNSVCKWLGLCSDSSISRLDSQPPTVVDTLPCTLCQYAVHYLDVIVQSNDTEAKIEDALVKVCSILPDEKLESQCKLFVYLYEKVIIKMLVEKIDPKQVCVKIGLCDKEGDSLGLMIEPSPLDVDLELEPDFVFKRK